MEQITIDDLRRTFCEMAMKAVRETVLNTAEGGTAFYWYIAGGAEILRLAEKKITAQENLEKIFNLDGPEPTGKYL